MCVRVVKMGGEAVWVEGGRAGGIVGQFSYPLFFESQCCWCII